MAASVHDVTQFVTNLVNGVSERATADGPTTQSRAVKEKDLVPMVKSAQKWVSEKMAERSITPTRLIVEVPNIAYDAVSFSLPTGFVHVYNIWERENDSEQPWTLMRYATVPINYTATTKRNVYDFQAGVTLEVTMPAATVATEFKVDGGKLIMVEEAAMPTSDIDLIPYAFDPIAYYTASLALMKPPSDLGMSREFKQVAEERLNSLITINTQMQQQRPMRPAAAFNSGFRFNRGPYGGY